MDFVTDLLQDAHFWVGVAFAILTGVAIFAGVPGMLGKFLDGRREAVQAQLDEAQRLREEAQALLAQVRQQKEDAEKLASQMLKNAETDAGRLRVEAAAKLKEQIERRGALAERRIATAEAQAAADVKAAAADIAAQTAERVLATRLAAQTSDPLVDAAIGDLGAKLQ